MRAKVVPIKNIIRLATAADALTTRATGLPGMGLLDAPIGTGKTKATMWLANRSNAVYIRAVATETPSTLLALIQGQLRVQPRGGTAQRTRDTVIALANAKRPLLVDEVNLLLHGRRAGELVETLRDIHDLSLMPVVLIGDETVEPRLQRYEQLASRIAQHIRFQPLDLEDARMLADQLCEVKIADDLLHHIFDHPRVARVTRRFVTALANAERRARTRGAKEIDLAAWGKGDVFTEAEAADSVSGKVAVIR
jgi:DNA transposition AAA+ family ATPase